MRIIKLLLIMINMKKQKTNKENYDISKKNSFDNNYSHKRYRPALKIWDQNISISGWSNNQDNQQQEIIEETETKWKLSVTSRQKKITQKYQSREFLKSASKQNYRSHKKKLKSELNISTRSSLKPIVFDFNSMEKNEISGTIKYILPPGKANLNNIMKLSNIDKDQKQLLSILKSLEEQKKNGISLRQRRRIRVINPKMSHLF